MKVDAHRSRLRLSRQIYLDSITVVYSALMLKRQVARAAANESPVDAVAAMLRVAAEFAEEAFAPSPGSKDTALLESLDASTFRVVHVYEYRLMLLRAVIRGAWTQVVSWDDEGPPEGEAHSVADVLAKGFPGVLNSADKLQTALYPHTEYEQEYWVEVLADGTPEVRVGR